MPLMSDPTYESEYAASDFRGSLRDGSDLDLKRGDHGNRNVRSTLHPGWHSRSNSISSGRLGNPS